ncbi:hypothetical protein Pelo_1645 [Pelomyxa schiedti]|nr:hypothetical protein Pelo_1645 [Pelomyxa schiedti]
MMTSDNTQDQSLVLEEGNPLSPRLSPTILSPDTSYPNDPASPAPPTITPSTALDTNAHTPSPPPPTIQHGGFPVATNGAEDSIEDNDEGGPVDNDVPDASYSTPTSHDANHAGAPGNVSPEANYHPMIADTSANNAPTTTATSTTTTTALVHGGVQIAHPSYGAGTDTTATGYFATGSAATYTQTNQPVNYGMGAVYPPHQTMASCVQGAEAVPQYNGFLTAYNFLKMWTKGEAGGLGTRAELGLIRYKYAEYCAQVGCVAYGYDLSRALDWLTQQGLVIVDQGQQYPAYIVNPLADIPWIVNELRNNKNSPFTTKLMKKLEMEGLTSM